MAIIENSILLEYTLAAESSDLATPRDEVRLEPEIKLPKSFRGGDIFSSIHMSQLGIFGTIYEEVLKPRQDALKAIREKKRMSVLEAHKSEKIKSIHNLSVIRKAA